MGFVNYVGGNGYYLGESRYSGWVIYKERFGRRERAIENYAYITGLNDIIYTFTSKSEDEFVTDKPQSTEVYIASYSGKAIAVYGNTRTIKATLMQMRGKFNRKLTINDQECAGWIFPKRIERVLKSVLTL